ncbi:uncharacterized protein LOC18433642 isoform X1 [Amborella trichopoda]|uniref:uncharacterized protein LOC18433642 isoform X1 n=1 Tax=Amborella trichopoda TaxID=13333 RepID=UPI0005D43B88|nr:uncharacterized protein LOC18433642 isoform X1 [Amborella trichopoda]|eukprot:XP_011623098.1 uncharacterized protein LOC18433642 isoform X1 [Amborella trichopoda]
MGTCVTWIPEDDLLLKNAVEAGASLESLAKGAVHFSRRFTIGELRDRWYALLYDPNIAVEAAARMVELELSLPTLPKSNRFCNSKGKEWALGKRKIDNARSHYYAQRKRIRNENADSFAQDVPLAPFPNIGCTENEVAYCPGLVKDPEGFPVDGCMSSPIANHFQLPDAGLDFVNRDFPQYERVLTADIVDGMVHGFDPVVIGSLGGDLPHGIMSRDCLYAFEGDTMSTAIVGNDNGPSFGHDNFGKDNHHILGDKSGSLVNSSQVPVMGHSQTMPMSGIIGNHSTGPSPFSTFNSMEGMSEGVGSGIGESPSFKLQVLDRFFHSSPEPSMPAWKPVGVLSKPDMPDRMNQESHEETESSLPRLANNCGKIDSLNCIKIGSPKHVALVTVPKLEEKSSDEGTNSLVSLSEGEFGELSNSLLDFVDEGDNLQMGIGKKDSTNMAGTDNLCSILLGSTNDLHQGDVSKSGDPRPSALQTCDATASPSSQMAHKSGFLQDDMICSLNRQDPDVPDNDDIFPSCQMESTPSSSLKDIYSERMGNLVPFQAQGSYTVPKTSEPKQVKVKEEPETSMQPIDAAQNRVSSGLLGAYPEGHVHDQGIKKEMPEHDEFRISSSKRACIRAADPDPCIPGSIDPMSIPNFNPQEGPSCMDMPSQRLASSKSCSSKILTNVKLETDLPPNILHNHTMQSPHADHGCDEHAVRDFQAVGFAEPVANISISDEEDKLSDSENDVPSFSDVEAMIMDMDLVSEDHETFFASNGLRYHLEICKRTIIRHEQAASSYMQRAAAARGAFAIFYGRHLKQYIKKPEVSLGRSTSDVSVDIDLGREGPANKISRRQAVIKMEEDGNFYLKNTGKYSIVVNSKEVASGQRFNLSPSCLIEIRGMRFIFEVNQSLVKQYVADMVKKSQENCVDEGERRPS